MGNVEATCDECGKTITRRAIAHVVGAKTVCTPCMHRIEHEEAKRNAPTWNDDDPTPRQIAFAERLGIGIPAGISKWDLSDLIDEAIHGRDAGRPMGRDQDDSLAELRNAVEDAERRKTDGARPRTAGGMVGRFVLALVIAALLIAGALWLGQYLEHRRAMMGL